MAARSMPVLILVTILALAVPCAASAGELRLSFLNGRVTLVARDVPLREVLAEWERVGGTHIVNRDTAPATPVTLDLTDVPEARALDVLLRQAAGYVASERIAPGETDSRFTQVVIMPGAAKLAAVPPAGARPSGALPGFRTEERPRVQQIMMPGSRAEDAGEEPARLIRVAPRQGRGRRGRRRHPRAAGG